MRRSLLRAAFRPGNLAILGLAVAAGLLIALWLLPIGLLAYAALVVLAWRDPASAPRPRRAAAPRGTVFQAQLDAISEARAQILASVAAAEGPLRQALERATAQVDGIVEEAYTLAEKGQMIVDYLQQTSLHDLNVQLARVEKQIRAASDPELRRQYEETRAAVAGRLRNAQTLGAYRERITAQLENIRANLDNVLAETVRLRAIPAIDPDWTTDSVSTRLSDVRADLDALGRVLDTAMSGVS